MRTWGKLKKILLDFQDKTKLKKWPSSLWLSVCSSEITNCVAFVCRSQKISEGHFLGSATESTTSLNTVALRLVSTVALERELEFWNLTDWEQMFSEKEELWNTELCLSTVGSDKNSEVIYLQGR